MKEWQKLANLGYENLKIWLKYLIFSWFEEPFCYPFFPFLPHLSLMDRTALISLFSVALFAIVAWFAGWLVNWLTDWLAGWLANWVTDWQAGWRLISKFGQTQTHNIFNLQGNPL